MKESNDVVNVDHRRRKPEDEETETAGELLNSITRHLPAKTRADIADTFRKRIERLLALGDDKGLPSMYMNELVGEVNRYLQVLDSE